MATTFNREEPMAGLPPNHVMESGGYAPVFKDMLEKEIALSLIKTTFEDKLKEYVELTRVSCPLFVTKRSGFNDNLVRFPPPTTTRLSWLQTPSSASSASSSTNAHSFFSRSSLSWQNGVERPATFAPRDFQDIKLEVPFSLAKWKRWALDYYGLKPGKGIVTDFRGLRCDDDVDFTHSLCTCCATALVPSRQLLKFTSRWLANLSLRFLRQTSTSGTGRRSSIPRTATSST
jgi:Aspartate-ammonia ligase